MRLRYLLVTAFLGLSVALRAADVVACVGDSITYGSRINNRPVRSYPATLQDLLPAGDTVGNFGVSGATMLKKGDKPYWNQPDFGKAQAFKPTIVVIMLGTNDSKPQNFALKDQFEADTAALADAFLSLPTKPRVYLCLPCPVYQTAYGINEASLSELRAKVARVAKAKGLELIDVQTALSGRPGDFPDGVHPNAVGAALIADAVAHALHP